MVDFCFGSRTGTGSGSFKTDKVCRRRGPVRLKADTPRFRLLSRFHSGDEVEKRAVEICGEADLDDWTAGARKGKTRSDCANGQLRGDILDIDIAAIRTARGGAFVVNGVRV